MKYLQCVLWKWIFNKQNEFAIALKIKERNKEIKKERKEKKKKKKLKNKGAKRLFETVTNDLNWDINYSYKKKGNSHSQ